MPHMRRIGEEMKKIFSILIICALLCSLLVACGDNDEEDTAGIIIGGTDDEGYYIPAPDNGDDTEDFELGGVPLT